jgi:hypothetical protein
MGDAVARGDTTFAKDLTAYQRGELASMTNKEREKADLAWSGASELLGYEGKTFEEIQTMIQKEDLSQNEKDVKEALLIIAYQRSSKQLSKLEK